MILLVQSFEKDMKIIKIDRTDKTPLVLIDYSKLSITISGVGISKDPQDFISELQAEIENYQKEHNEVTLNITLEYFNTGFSKCLLMIFIKLAKSDFKKIDVNWYADEDDSEIREAGEMFQEITKLEFNYMAIPKKKKK